MKSYIFLGLTALDTNDDTEYSYIWSQQFFQNSDLLIALIRNCVLEQLTHEWYSLIQTHQKRPIRDRPFNLHGGYGFIFSFRNFSADNTRVNRIFFFVANMFPEFNIRLYDKSSASDYFFFLHQNQNIFSATLGIRIFFFQKKKKHNPPLEVKQSVPYRLFKENFEFENYFNILEDKDIDIHYVNFEPHNLNYRQKLDGGMVSTEKIDSG